MLITPADADLPKSDDCGPLITSTCSMLIKSLSAD